MLKKYLLGGAAAFAMITGAAAIAQTAPGGPAPQASHPGHARMMQTETRADVQARIAQHFAKLDTNRDGFVTKAEAEALKTERADKRTDRQAQRFDPNRMFDRLDANKDGKITPAEAEAAKSARVARNDGKPAQAHAVAVGGLFARVDTNKDGVITRNELAAAPRPQRPNMERAGMRPGGGFAGRMFDLADANKDGRVSLQEAQQLALQHFDRADLNHDGKLTPQERQQARQALGAQRRPS